MTAPIAAPRFWIALALMLGLAGALAARLPVDAGLPPYPALYSGAI